mmetsp:Transcript_108629/g.350666  ORF Transcript_108629/g.350666 Transcript_108629/m.350666 type:complete len:217 (-) Transcript_108629:418-1068(-)
MARVGHRGGSCCDRASPGTLREGPGRHHQQGALRGGARAPGGPGRALGGRLGLQRQVAAGAGRGAEAPGGLQRHGQAARDAGELPGLHAHGPRHDAARPGGAGGGRPEDRAQHAQDRRGAAAARPPRLRAQDGRHRRRARAPLGGHRGRPAALGRPGRRGRGRRPLDPRDGGRRRPLPGLAPAHGAGAAARAARRGHPEALLLRPLAAGGPGAQRG